MLTKFIKTFTTTDQRKDIRRTQVLKKFHEYFTINMTSRVQIAKPLSGHKTTSRELTRKTAPPLGQYWTIHITPRVLTRKTATPPGNHVFQPTGTIFEIVQDFIWKYVLPKFNEDWT
ncbi:hypothetical protein DPMN_003977 [Dreissena polymorpha]|uniref:Uncharacterized protein n=1 Tax=Dreissena polymorpha TaxID=45954 RepID=A0A9D4RV80_DREPO|nr:hypothetical protein DPMN_003977 [Dreissena polymorpha]